MEKDCLIAHGTASTIQERLFKMSDPYKVSVCSKCGNIVPNIDICKNCGEDSSVDVNIPYACKLFFQELNAMNIKTSILPNTKVETPKKKESIFKQEIRRKSEKNKLKIQESIEEENIL